LEVRRRQALNFLIVLKKSKSNLAFTNFTVDTLESPWDMGI